MPIQYQKELYLIYILPFPSAGHLCQHILIPVFALWHHQTVQPWVHFSKDAPTDISDCYGRNQHLSDPEWPNSQCSTPSKLKIMRSMLLVSLLLWYLQAPTLWTSFLAPFFWVLQKLMFILKFTSLQLHDKMQNHCGQKRTLTEHSKTADHPGKTAVHDKLVWIYLNHDF